MTLSQLKASMRWFSYLGVLAVLIVLGGIGGWAAFAEIQGAVMAPGQMVVESTSKRIQHRDGGIIAKINVKNGDRVQAGQELLLMDDTEARAELAIIESIRIEWLAKTGRLRAKRDGSNAISFDPELLGRQGEPAIADALRGQEQLFEAQNAALKGRQEQLSERVVQLEKQITGLEAQLASGRKQSGFIERELTGARQLLEQGLVQMPRVLALEREAAQLEGQQGQLVSEIARAQGQIAEIRLQMIQLADDARTRTLTELREAEARLQEFAERKIAIEAKLKRTRVTAPRNGVVHELAVHTIGGVVAPGETVMLVVPDEDDLVIEARVRPQDIDQVFQGQRATLRFPNADSHLTPQVHGEVVQVSADLKQVDAQTPPYYSVRMKVEKGELPKLGDLELKPGMPVEAFIQTKPLSPMAYLMQPLTDQLNRAFRER
jgi:HlyD family secretion protein